MTKTTVSRNEHLFCESRRAALRVDFIDTIEEFRFYSRALYGAMMWAKKNSNEQPKKELKWWETISRK